MNRKLLFPIMIFLMLIASACSGGEATPEPVDSPSDNPSDSPTVDEYPTNTPGPLAQRTQAGSFFAFNEVGLGPEGFVALTNFTEVEVTLEGLYLCQGSDCFPLPAVVVEGGETVRIAVGDGDGLENVVASQATLGDLRPTDGELALFASEDTSDAAGLLVYLQWGSTPHDLTSLAVERGLWFETSYAPSGPNATRLFRVEESGLWLWE